MQIIGIGLMAGMLLAAMIWGYRMTPTDTPCTSLDIRITDKAERSYVTVQELSQLLRNADLYPVGRTLDVVSLSRMESAVKSHPMVRTADCYLTPRNEVKIRLTQRVPLLRVQTPTETYLIDTDRRVMPARECVKDKMLLATGNVGPQMAASQLAEFAVWLQEDDYWRTRIHHLHVQSPQMIYLYLASGDGTRTTTEKVVLGPMRGYERKLAKLQTFLEKGREATKDKQYYELDLRYRGQVIARKNI